MADLIIASFPDRNSADRVVDELEKSGYKPENISVITQAHTVSTAPRESATSAVVDNVAGGIIGGGTIGGLAGILAAAFGVVVIGPIAALIGATGIAATVITGAVIGAATGGIVGALADLGLSRDVAERYSRSIESGGAVVAAPIKDNNADEIRSIFDRNKAEDVSELSRDIKKKE